MTRTTIPVDELVDGLARAPLPQADRPLRAWQQTKLQWARQRDAALTRWVMQVRQPS